MAGGEGAGVPGEAVESDHDGYVGVVFGAGGVVKGLDVPGSGRFAVVLALHDHLAAEVVPGDDVRAEVPGAAGPSAGPR